MNSPDEYNERIVAGAAELFRSFGIRAVTMDDIAGHLGISKRTIYERFHDKDELLYAVLVNMIEKQKEKIEKIVKDSPDVISAIFIMIKAGRDHMESMNPLISSDLKKYHTGVLKRLKATCGHPDFESAGRIFKAGIEQGVFRGDLDVEILSRTFSSMGTVIGDENLFPPDNFMHRDLVRNIIVNYLRGISTPEGLAIIDSLEPEI